MMKKENLTNFLNHLGLFLLVEIVFVLIIFREFPETSLLTLIGVLHTSYWIVILLAWFVREKYAYRVRQKFLCTYVPVVYHVVIHIVAGAMAVEEMAGHAHEQHHDEHSVLRLRVGTICAWVLIALGEYWLHRTRHCETHHVKAHVHCHDEECEKKH